MRLPQLLAANYTLESITPAVVGWRVVYWTGQAHVVEAVALFCLATATAQGTPPEIISLSYQPEVGWFYCEGDPTFCGLLPPGADLSWYEARDPHDHVPGVLGTRTET